MSYNYKIKNQSEIEEVLFNITKAKVKLRLEKSIALFSPKHSVKGFRLTNGLGVKSSPLRLC